MKSIFKVLVMCVAIAFISCGKDDDAKLEDSKVPELMVTSPSMDSKHSIAIELEVEGTCKDDIELAKLTISVKQVTLTQASIKSVKEPWTPEDIVIELSGTEQAFKQSFAMMPADAVIGDYSVNFVLEDAKGNKTTESVSIEIE